MNKIESINECNNKRYSLIFSGYNQRSVLALCRYFTKYHIPFVLVSSGNDDTIYKTTYTEKIIMKRKDKELSLKLFEMIVSIMNENVEFVYCPTSEYLNYFVLRNKDSLNNLRILTGMPDKKIYEKLTNKFTSQIFFSNLEGIHPISKLFLENVSSPCVIKPYKNIILDKVLYPILCNSKDELEREMNNVDLKIYFIEQYIEGQSYYLCGYLALDGSYSFYWQENLLQQENGKSIVFARSCSNPGLSEKKIMNKLIEANYFGPFMIEFIESSKKFYFIEMNPRFWGPLQLGVDCGCSFLSLYTKDWFNIKNTHEMKKETVYYSWYHGSKSVKLKIYPAFKSVPDADAKISYHDVYNRSDSIDLKHVS